MAIDETLLTVLKEKLLQEKNRLESELLVFTKRNNASGDYIPQKEEIGTDPDANATEVEMYIDALGLEANLTSQLKDVDSALHKMTQGTYGICEETDKEIDKDRLMAYPAARTAL